MAYFAEGEEVYIHSPIFDLDHEGIVVSVPEGDERYYDVRVIVTEDAGHVDATIPFLEDELTKQ
jgi:hypothetical protein